MGHAYTTTLADALARHSRLMGEKTYLLTGSDENTQKMVEAAHKAGQDPMEFLDAIAANFANLFKQLNISYDQFIRTTDQAKHWPGAVALWNKLVASGDIYEKEYEGLYCVGHEAFMTEKELVEGKCPDHGTTPERLKEMNYFFKLSRYGEAVREKIESGELRIVPATRKNEVLSFIASGLEDVSFSRVRRSDWPEGLGVPVPGDPAQIMYVWCDALANYVTALGYGQADDALYQEFWPGTHVIGKDILRFHAIIWPAMLLSAGLPLPKTLLAHGLINSGGRKMSKSLGNVIDPEELIAKYGTDAVRYFLLRHISPFEDGDITLERFAAVYEGELVNGLGNLVARVMQLAEKNLSAPVARPEPGDFTAEYGKFFDTLELNRAVDLIWERIQKLDKQITDEEPFKVVKVDPERGQAMIAAAVLEVYAIARMLQPCMPATSDIIKAAVLANKKPENLFPRI